MRWVTTCTSWLRIIRSYTATVCQRPARRAEEAAPPASGRMSGLARRGPHAGRRSSGPEQPSRRAREQERRQHQGEQQVLHHVDGEQIVVAQVVDRPVERHQQHEQRRRRSRRSARRHRRPQPCAAAERPIPQKYKAPRSPVPIRTVDGGTSSGRTEWRASVACRAGAVRAHRASPARLARTPCGTP